jgi:hypothetical protein
MEERHRKYPTLSWDGPGRGVGLKSGGGLSGDPRPELISEEPTYLLSNLTFNLAESYLAGSSHCPLCLAEAFVSRVFRPPS